MSSFPNSLQFLLTGIIPYFMTGLAPSAGAFGTFLLACTCVGWCDAKERSVCVC